MVRRKTSPRVDCNYNYRNACLVKAVRPCLEQLETRTLLVASVYVGENLPTDFTITNDADLSGPLLATNGDTVTWNPSGTQHPQGAVPGLIFGTDAFSTAGGGITAVDVGGTVYVEAGTYPENVVVAKRLTLSGAKFGTDARGRVVGAPNPLSEALIAPLTGRALELQTGATNVVINGLSFVGLNSGAVGVVESTTGATDGLQFRNNHVAVGAGATASALFLNKNAIDADIDHNVFVAAAGSSQAVFFDGADQFHGMRFFSNNVQKTGASSGTGLFIDGNHNWSITGTARIPLIEDSIFEGFSTGANLGSRSFGSQATPNAGIIRANTFRNNGFDGLQGGVQNTLVTRNTINNNGRSGLALTSFGSLAVDRGAQNSQVTENFFFSNTTEDIFFSAGQAAGTISTNSAFGNSLLSTIGVTYNGTETINTSGNWWGTFSNPEVAGKIGGTGAGNVDYTPWLHFGTDTAAGTLGFQGDFSYLHVDDDSAQFGSTERIREGIDLLTDGSLTGSNRIVDVEAGTYALTAAVNVNKQLRLLGEQAGVDARTRTAVPESIINGAAVAAFPVTALNVSVSGVTVDGLTVQGISGAQAQAGITLVAGTNNSRVLNNIIQNNNVGVFAANNSSVNATLIEKNLFLNNTAAGPASGHGVYADEFTAGAGMQNVDIQNNKFNNTAFVLASFGVGMSNTHATTPFTDISISNNETDNFGRGMYLFHTTGSTISGNNIDGAQRYAIGMFGITGVGANATLTVSNNTLANNGASIWIDDDAPGTAYSGALTLSGNSYTTTGAQKSIINTSTTAVNATADIFNGVLASSATLAQQFVIVDTIVDGVDAPGRGLVRTRALNVYVTPNSFFQHATYLPVGTTTPSIQRGVDVASSGDTVNIQGATYAESVSINKALTIDGEGSGAVPLVTWTSDSTNPLATITSTNITDDITFLDIAFDATNGANTAGDGIRAFAPTANFDALTVDRSTFTDFSTDAINVAGDAVTGISPRNIVVSNSTFTNNGTFGGGGNGDISLFTYNRDASFTNLTLVGNGTASVGARLGIQLRGTGDALGNGFQPMGTVSFNNVDISGSYRTQMIGIQRYTSVNNLSFTGVKLGSATSAIAGTFGALLRFDTTGVGTVSSPATVNLGNTHFRGVSVTSAQPTQIEFAPDGNFTFLRANATTTIWDLPSGTNIAAASLSVPQAYDVEDRILDYPKNLPAAASFKGWAEVQNGKAFVTPTVLGVITGNSISRASEVVDSNGTVHIKPGTYTENVITNTNSARLAPGNSPGIVTINGNITLDGNDALVMEINGLTAGTQHDQFIINGTVTLGGATLDTTGSTIVATQGQIVQIIENDASDPVSGFFAAPANGNGNVILVNGQPFFVLYNGDDGNDVVLVRAPNGTPPGPQPAPTIVFVDDNWTANTTGQDTDGPAGGSLGNGTAKGIDQFDNIQDAIDAVAAGGEIRIYGGNYAESLIVNKSLDMLAQDFIQSTVVGDNINDVVVDPPTTVTDILEITSSNVEVAGMLIEGDNVDSRGILATHATATLTGLNIHYNLVRNTDRRGIQSDTYLAGFEIYDNVVQNVNGAADAIGIFNFGGGGLPGTAQIHDNTVTGSTVGIAGQQSAGMQVFDNNITMVAGGVGIQDSNPGTGSPPPAGATETFTNNTITGGDATAYGLIVINQAMDVLMDDNNVTTPGVGMGAYGHFGTPLRTTTFDGNTVDAATIGIEISTDTFGFNGVQDVDAVVTDNDVSGSTGAGILVKDTDGAAGAVATADINNNVVSIHDNFIGIDVDGGTATIASNDIHDNTTGIRVRNGGDATVTSNTFTGNGIGLVADGGSALITNTQEIDGVGINNGGLVTLAVGSNTVLITTSLTISGSGQLDVRDNAAIVDYTGSTPAASIRSRLVSGYAAGNWNGAGIMSTDAFNDPNDETAVGYSEASHLFNSFPVTWEGQQIDNTSILILYTLYGDADLDKRVNLSDYNRLAGNFNQTSRVWSQGDFNYDNNVNLADYNLLAGNYNQILARGGASAVTSGDDELPSIEQLAQQGGRGTASRAG